MPASVVLAVLAVALAAASVLAVSIGLLTARRLNALAEATRRLQAGDLETEVPQGGVSGLRQLAASLEGLRVALRDARPAVVPQRGEGLALATQQLTVLHEVVAQLAHSPADGPRVAAASLLRLEGVDGAFVALADERGQLALAAERGLGQRAPSALRTLQHTFTTDALGAGAYVPDTSCSHELKALTEQGIGAIVLLPLRAAEGIAGILAATSALPRAFPEASRLLLRAISDELAASIERAELAGEAEESRRLADAVLREMSDGVIVLDGDGRCRVCNPAAAELLRIERERVLDQPARAWLPLPAGAFDALRARAARPAQVAAPLFVAAAGRDLAVTAGPFLEPDTGRSGMILLLRDLTDLAAAERIKQDFVSMVGHELRTPLTLIRTSIDLLAEEATGRLTPTQQRIAEVLRNNSDRLLQLINDLLDMSALDSGRMQVRQLQVDVAEVVRETVDAHQRDAEEHSVSLLVELPRGAVPAWADRGRVRQVLSNLVANAVKYTPAGGHVVVRARIAADEVRIEVTDDGIGIPPAEHDRLFEKFFRTRAGQRHSGGTGLGLAIARSIVELHGGKIWCESDGTSGSIFAFTLPRRSPDDRAVAPGAHVATGSR